MINRKIIYRIMGVLLLIETILLLGCSAVSLYYGENDLQSFLITAGITALAGFMLIAVGRDAERKLSRRDSYIIVSISWIVISLFGMLPFYISRYIPDFTNAFFETISGFTSSGSTILDNIESFPHGLLFWRSMTQWIGGLGIIFFTIAVLPIFGASGGVQLFAAEASGTGRNKVHPRISVTAKWIWSIYIGMTIAEAILLLFGGMGIFDSICHALTTTSTGGFSTKQNSIGYYQSTYIEYIISGFMILSGINFTLLLLLVNGKLKRFRQDNELKWYLSSICLFTLFITIVLCCTGGIEIEEAFRKALFHTASAQTSTGFTTDDYMAWAPVGWNMIALLMILGGCAGSTSGGIKCIRLNILGKISSNEFKRIIHPNAVIPLRINRHTISHNTQSTIMAFTFIYVAIIIVSALFFVALGINGTDSMGIAISSIGNMGLGLGNFGPEFSWSGLPDPAKWLSTLLMLIGRLELFTVLLLFTPAFWKRN